MSQRHILVILSNASNFVVIVMCAMVICDEWLQQLTEAQMMISIS